VSLTRRILEGARSGLSQLTSMVIVDDEPLSHVEAAALEAELAARRKARRGPPGSSAIARLAGATAAARAERARLAEERARRIHGDRDRREASRKAAADEAFRRMKDQAGRGGPIPRAGAAGGGASGASAGARAPKPGSGAAQVAEWYKTLNLSPGADLAEVKSSYRALMRKYHPDMHAGNPTKQKAANELSLKVTAAYNGLQAHLAK
jgi:DnaJ-domain-containing protein 1